MPEQTKKWVETWRKAGKALEEEKIRELTDPHYYEKHLPGLNALLQYACEHRVERTTTGLIEWQKTVKKIHEQSR